MSIQSRRNSLFKSSISIRSINDAVLSFSEGLKSARKNADEIIKTTRQRNIFKRNLVRNDNLFFRRRQENLKRKEREDELEASSVQGVPKTQGTILAKSTRGFLGRMLDFIGILILGWAITNLPKIISGIQGLIKRISSVTGILGFFIDGVKNIVVGIGTVIKQTLASLLRFDFLKDKKDIEEGLENAQSGLASSQKELVLAATEFAEDPAASANLGIPDPPGLDVTAAEGQKSEQKDDKEAEIKDSPEITADKKEIQDITGKFKDAPKDVTEQEEVVEGDAEDVEGIKNDLESALQEDSSPAGSGGGGAPSFGETGESIEDPRDTLKKRQKESLSQKVKSREKITSVAKSPFLDTPDSVENISQSVTPASNTMLASVDQYNPDFQTGSRKVNLSSLVSPSKKEVNVTGKRKPKSTVIIMEKPVNTANSSVSMPSGDESSFDIGNQVSEEKLLMKMQSTSTLKYT